MWPCCEHCNNTHCGLELPTLSHCYACDDQNIYLLCIFRWGFVTHGCVDGYSRVITYLGTATTNEAKVVLNLFVQSCSRMGVPSRVRCDRGNENLDVALFLTLLRGNERGSVISGKSVHNQRIERMWRAVATQVTEFFYKLFYELEDDSVLDIENEVHMVALTVVFLPLINKRMQEFRSAWNDHRLRTEQNRSPKQVWLDGMLQNMNSGHLSTSEIFDQHPSLDLRIEQAVNQFNIDISQFVGSNTIQPAAIIRHVEDGTMYQIDSHVNFGNERHEAEVRNSRAISADFVAVINNDFQHSSRITQLLALDYFCVRYNCELWSLKFVH